MQHRNSTRNAFSLVELLVSITIVIVLASIALYGMAGMQNLAKTQRTKTQISKLHTLLMEHWEDYEFRRVDVGPGRYFNAPFLANLGTSQPAQMALVRLTALRELMRYEMPDRQSDIQSDLLGLQYRRPPVNTPLGQPMPSLVKNYHAFIKRNANNPNWGNEHQGAECLYMIVSQMHVGDTHALEMFQESDIGDADGDGMPEFLDGWGNPIRLIRWPAGYPSQLHPIDTDRNTPGIQPEDTDRATPGIQVARDFRDPFDVLNLHAIPALGLQPSFAMTPLIVSPGPDGEFGLEIAPDNDPLLVWYLEGSQQRGLCYDFGNGSFDFSFPPNNPYFLKSGINPLGTIVSENLAADNITNHSLQTSLR